MSCQYSDIVVLHYKTFYCSYHYLIVGPSCVSRAGGGPHIEAQYRQPPQITKNQKFQAELLSGAMWFWILWHIWHDPDAVLVS